MFFTTMVRGFIYSANSNKNASNLNQQQQLQQQPPSPTSAPPQDALQQPIPHLPTQQPKSPKLNKKTGKFKQRSLSKTESKKSLSDLPKTRAKDPAVERPTTSSNCDAATSSYTSHSIQHNKAKELPSTSRATLKPPTKVKSGSWKRSEKQISSYNGIPSTGKKSKSLRKRSPTWLKFPNTPVKIAEKATYVSPTHSTSVCRPGTLYSDVLFGAGSSCLVKIKTLTPRRNANAAQKKLSKALLKCSGGIGNEEASDSEADNDGEFFPNLAVAEVAVTTTRSSSPPSTTTTTTATSPDDSPRKVGNTSPSCAAETPGTTDATSSAPPKWTITAVDTNLSNSTAAATALSATNPLPPARDDHADIIILPETTNVDISSLENGFNGVSYGNYLEQHFKQMNGNTATPTLFCPKTLNPNLTDLVLNGKSDGVNIVSDSVPAPDFASSHDHVSRIVTKPFTIDIPQWNFTEISADGYPKFLCQFDDEHYLKAEKMAMLGLKLALGNGNSNPQQGKFKF